MLKKVLATSLLLALAALQLEAQQVCGTPGQDGPFSGGGTVNTYFPPSGTVALQSGATSFDVGTPAGAADTIAVGNLLLIMQMQDGRFNSSNTDSYGSGVSGPGSGFTDVANAGLYEYAVVTNVAGSTITVTGAGPGNGLINKYVNEDFQNAAHTFDENNDGDTTDPEDAHAAHGRRRFQIVRVPQYTTLTITTQMTCLPWNPSTALGGVLAVDVQSDLVFSGVIDHINVTQRGFRGAGATRARGQLGAFAGLYSGTDFRQRSDQPAPDDGAHGNKGEGISGTPRFVFDPFGPPGVIQDLTIEGYPNGIRARGAPGTAGGGGNSGDPSGGTAEAGGGGGGNGGAGGIGGNSRTSNLPIGGRGGGAFPWAANRLAMGGGGGAGQRNDASDDTSHAATGGGIVLIRTNTTSLAGGAVAGRILADGGDAVNDTANDGGGGGGAGGSVLIFARTPGQLANVLVFARGGRGGDCGSGGNPSGPGGGGGGGVILASDALGGADTSAGPTGVTDTPPQSYGAAAGTGDLDVPGDPGNPFVTENDLPGAGGGSGCSVNDPPNAVDDVASTGTNTLVSIAVLTNDSDPEGAALLLTLVSDPPNGTAAINGNNIDYTPDPAFTGTDTFTYTISDGNTTDTATVTVTVGNLAPVNTVPGAQSTPENTAVVFTGGTAISVDDPDDSAPTIQVTLTVTSGTLTLSGTAGLTFNAGDGTADATMTFSGSEADVNAALNGLSFQPATGSLAPVTLTVTTNDLAAVNPLTDTDTVAITVTAVNDPPVAVADAYDAFVDQALTVPGASGVLVNDSDPEGDTLTAVLDVDVTNGTLVLNPDGSFTYTPNPGFLGVDAFTYHADDGPTDSNIVTVTITVSVAPVLSRKYPAGYCGLLGMEILVPLGALWLIRRRRPVRGIGAVLVAVVATGFLGTGSASADEGRWIDAYRTLSLQEDPKPQDPKPEAPPPAPAEQAAAQDGAPGEPFADRWELGAHIGICTFSSEFEADPEFAAGINVRAALPWFSKTVLGLEEARFGLFLDFAFSSIERDIPALKDPDGTLIFFTVALDIEAYKDESFVLRPQLGIQYGNFGGVTDLDDGIALLLGVQAGINLSESFRLFVNPQVGIGEDVVFFLPLGVGYSF